MNAKRSRSRRILVFTLLISLIMMLSMPGNTLIAEAKEASLALTGFVKVSPANGATNQPVSLKLDWNPAPSNPYGHSMYYKYCYYTSGGTCSFNGILSATQLNITGLTSQTTYYWQIQVVYCKDGSCVQKEKHEANDGQVWSFKTGGTPPPASFTKVAPANNAVNVSSRTLSWAASSGATSYQYCFSPNANDNNCAHLNGWRNVGNVTSYSVPNDAKFIWGNRYYWQVRASNGGGTNLADNGTWWSFTTADLVGKATLVSPSGVIAESTPTFRWNQVTGVTWYYLWVNTTGGNVFKHWYHVAAVCSGGTCATTPSITLKSGNFTWWVQTYNPSGYGPWSDGLSFNTPVPTPPTAATLLSPDGDIGVNYSPTFSWTAVVRTAEIDDKSAATWYFLSISNASGVVFQEWYPSSICNGGTCSVTPSLTLGGGTYRWAVRAWNSAGYGPWSAPMNFHTQTAPGVVTLISPNGVSSNPISYQWNHNTNVVWYLLKVNNASGNVLAKWYQASAICNATTCTVAAPAPLASGSYSWWVRPWNSAGYGPWSTPLNFSIP